MVPVEVLLWLALVAVAVFQDMPSRMLQAVPFWNFRSMPGLPYPLEGFPPWALVPVAALSFAQLLQFP
jgi:hypothetical protein